MFAKVVRQDQYDKWIKEEKEIARAIIGCLIKANNLDLFLTYLKKIQSWVLPDNQKQPQKGKKT